MDDSTIECPKCLYTQTIGELRRTHRCGKCGHSTRSGAQQHEERWRDEVAALTAKTAELSAQLKALREAAGKVALAFHDWPEYVGTEICQGERECALDCLREALETKP